jgi:deoxyhypusine synthase
MTGSRPSRNSDRVAAEVKDAVFVTSDPVPEGAMRVRGIDFNLHKDGDISVVDLVEGMSNMGFQASAIGDAVRIINEMVRRRCAALPKLDTVIL